MRLLKIAVEGVPLFEDDRLELDFYAQDRVPRKDDGMPVADVTQVGRAKSVFSQNIVGISGVNAPGKTTTLRLIRFDTPRFIRSSYADEGNIVACGGSASAVQMHMASALREQ